MTNSKEDNYDLTMEHASRPYNNIGEHLLIINCFYGDI